MVCCAILDTTLQSNYSPVTKPRTSISAVLLDADVANFGSQDFFNQSELIRQERQLSNGPEFQHWVAALLSAHTWHTRTATKLWQLGKEENMRKLAQT